VPGDLCALPPSTAEPGEAAEAGLRDRHGVGPKCGGWLKIIGAILGQPVIEKILTHLGLQAWAARAKPVVASVTQLTDEQALDTGESPALRRWLRPLP